MNISITSNEMNQMYNNTSYKRSSSPLRQISNANVKKRKASVDNLSSKVSNVQNIFFLCECEVTATDIFSYNIIKYINYIIYILYYYYVIKIYKYY